MAHLAKHVDMVAKALGDGLQQSPHRDGTGPEGGNDLRLHRPRHRLVRTPRRHHRTPDTDKGSAYKSHAFRDLLTACTSATSEPALHAPEPPNQWQGRSLHPDSLREWPMRSHTFVNRPKRRHATMDRKRPHSALDASFTFSASFTALLL